MEDQKIITVDLHGALVENPTLYTWRSKSEDLVPIKISENLMYNELFEILIYRIELNCDKYDLCITYMLIERQKGAPFRIKNNRDL